MARISKYIHFSMLLFAMVPTGIINAQQVITLNRCYEAAAANAPLSSEKSTYAEISSLKEKNLSAAWFPTIDLNGSILYNSDVPDLGSNLASLPVPGLGNAIGSMPHDQYKVTLDINQVIYDGGAVRGRKELERAELRVNENQTEIDLYRLRSQVNGYYFGILLLLRQKEILKMYYDLLEKRLLSAQSAVENGVMLRTDADAIKAEILLLGQQLEENEIKTFSMLKALSHLTGLEINSPEGLRLPSVKKELKPEIIRPEIRLIDAREQQLTAGETLISVTRMPKAFGFATLGYGNPPGSNFFVDEFDTYYIIGAGLKWNILDWNKSRNEKKVISLQRDMLVKRKEDLTGNISRQLYLKEAEIESLEKLIETDNELITIRKKITASAGSQHLNGTITATEYLNILNSEKQAAVNSEIHLINLALARVEYLNISGQDPE